MSTLQQYRGELLWINSFHDKFVVTKNSWRIWIAMPCAFKLKVFTGMLCSFYWWVLVNQIELKFAQLSWLSFPSRTINFRATRLPGLNFSFIYINVRKESETIAKRMLPVAIDRECSCTFCRYRWTNNCHNITKYCHGKRALVSRAGLPDGRSMSHQLNFASVSLQ